MKTELQRLIHQNLSTREIAKVLNISQTNVRYNLKKYGLKTSPKNKNGRKPLGYIDNVTWTEDQRQAYSFLLGFFLGDGHITGDKSFKITNYIYFEEMNNRIIDNINILYPEYRVKVYKKKNCNAIDICVHSKNFCGLFPKYKGKKHNTILFFETWMLDIIDQYKESFITGLIESDGCIQITSKGYFQISFKNMSTQLHELLHKNLKQLNIEYSYTNNSGVYLTRLSSKKRNLQKIFKFLKQKEKKII